MKALYHNFPLNSSSNLDEAVEFFTPYTGIVRRRTPTGCIVDLILENGSIQKSFVFGQWSIGSRILVSITKVYTDRYPRGVCESVLQYAEDVA